MPYTVYALAGQEHWCRVQFRLVQAMSVLVPCAVSARAGKERLCRLLGSCERGALVSPFRLVRTRSFGCYRFVKRFGRGVPRNLHSKEP